jgi:hypothetical protein
VCIAFVLLFLWPLQERDKLAAALPEYILPFVLFLMAHMPGELLLLPTAYDTASVAIMSSVSGMQAALVVGSRTA